MLSTLGYVFVEGGGVFYIVTKERLTLFEAWRTTSEEGTLSEVEYALGIGWGRWCLKIVILLCKKALTSSGIVDTEAVAGVIIVRGTYVPAN